MSDATGRARSRACEGVCYRHVRTSPGSRARFEHESEEIRKRRDRYSGIRTATRVLVVLCRGLSPPVATCRGLSRLAAPGRALAGSLRYTGRGASVSCSGE
jgi:hypothetical protein